MTFSLTAHQLTSVHLSLYLKHPHHAPDLFSIDAQPQITTILAD